MKLQQATELASLREAAWKEREASVKEKTAMQVAKEVFADAEEKGHPFLYMSPTGWAKQWLPSKRFKLVKIPLNAAALPCEPKSQELVIRKLHAEESQPIVIDYNKNQVGSSLNGFTPQIIVIDGKHRFQAATLRGESHIMAWVGEIAIGELQAAKDRAAIRKKVKMKACGCGGSSKKACSCNSDGKKVEEMDGEELEGFEAEMPKGRRK